MIISNDFELRRFIPNVMSTVEGEGSLYEKIEPYMGLVEVSLSDIFIGPEMLANPRSMPEALRNAASVYVANEAFRMAVPSLDLVLLTASVSSITRMSYRHRKSESSA